MALLDGCGEAPPSHTWRGLAYVCGISAHLRYGPGQPGPPDGLRTGDPALRTLRTGPGGPCGLDPALRTLRASRSCVPIGWAVGQTLDQTVDQTVDSPVDSRLSRGITRAFLWISQRLRKILKFLARKPCASSPKRSTNSFIARAEVLPGGNSRDAGETRATGKPGNRDFSCCF